MNPGKLTLITAAVAALGLVTSSAQLIDNMTDTNNFSGTFGGDTLSLGPNGVTITRVIANQDAGATWGNVNGDLQFSTENMLTLTPAPAPYNTDDGGYLVVNIILFDSSGAYLGEPNWLPDGQYTTPQSVDVSQFAINNSQPTATQYALHIRIDPYSQAGADYTISQIAAVPEPASSLLLLAGLPLLLTLRRSRQG